ncbi:MAG: cyclic pyranopterin monophosphate synthase MoaC [Planctomycetes bacterium]|nr:cyclic pyranopterin monophosphate synthase MoaC [Planctomycetota bacterium]
MPADAPAPTPAPPPAGFTHLRPDGSVNMVDVGAKPATERVAVAGAAVLLRPETLRAIQANTVAKGNVFETARIAGLQAAKRTAELIPLCHPLRLTHVAIDFAVLGPGRIGIRATVRAHDRTGVEMEALTAAAVAGLTIYDMCKAVDREMTLTDLCLLEKSGGKSGAFRRAESAGGVAPAVAEPDPPSCPGARAT